MVRVITVRLSHRDGPGRRLLVPIDTISYVEDLGESDPALDAKARIWRKVTSPTAIDVVDTFETIAQQINGAPS